MDSAPPPVEEAKKEEKAEAPADKPGEVSLVKGSLRRQGGRLPRSAMSGALEPVLGKFEACYEKTLSKSKKKAPQGTLQLSWVVRPSGSVDRVQKSGGTFKDAGTIACVTRPMKSADYPKPKGGVGGYARYIAICPPDWPHGVSVIDAPGAPLPKQPHPLKRNAEGVLVPTP